MSQFFVINFCPSIFFLLRRYYFVARLMYRQGDGLKQEHLSVSFFLFPPICSAYSNMIIQCGYAIQYLIQSILLFRSKALPTTIYLLPVVVYTIKYLTNIISHFPFLLFSPFIFIAAGL